MNNKKYLTAKEAAIELGVTPQYIRELLGRASYDSTIKLKGTKVGKEWRIDPLSINEFLGVKEDTYILKLQDKIKDLEIKNEMLVANIEIIQNLANSILTLTNGANIKK